MQSVVYEGQEGLSQPSSRRVGPSPVPLRAAAAAECDNGSAQPQPQQQQRRPPRTPVVRILTSADGALPSFGATPPAARAPSASSAVSPSAAARKFSPRAHRSAGRCPPAVRRASSPESPDSGFSPNCVTLANSPDSSGGGSEGFRTPPLLLPNPVTNASFDLAAAAAVSITTTVELLSIDSQCSPTQAAPPSRAGGVGGAKAGDEDEHGARGALAWQLALAPMTNTTSNGSGNGVIAGGAFSATGSEPESEPSLLNARNEEEFHALLAEKRVRQLRSQQHQQQHQQKKRDSASAISIASSNELASRSATGPIQAAREDGVGVVGVASAARGDAGLLSISHTSPLLLSFSSSSSSFASPPSQPLPHSFLSRGQRCPTTMSVSTAGSGSGSLRVLRASRSPPFAPSPPPPLSPHPHPHPHLARKVSALLRRFVVGDDDGGAD